MPKIGYIRKKLRDESLDVIHQAGSIIEEYQALGFLLTVRQVYYKFVGRNLFPEDRRWRLVEGTNKWVRDPKGTKNAPPNYFWLGDKLKDGRLLGLLDWEAIEDRTRALNKLPHWRDTEHILQTAVDQFRRDRWAAQPIRVEVWIEKEALASVFEPICQELEVPFFCCRGYPSKSSMWEAAQRFRGYEKAGQEIVILHFGDHDPSGVHMTENIEDEMGTFRADVRVDRLALNMDQVNEYGLSPDPAKLTDSRAKKYVPIYGPQSWELDALDPPDLTTLVEDAVLALRDEDAWKESMDQDTGDVAALEWTQKNWAKVRKMGASDA